MTMVVKDDINFIRNMGGNLIRLITLSYFIFVINCNSDCSNQNILLSPNGKKFIYLYHVTEKDNKSFNETALYLYLTDYKIPKNNCVPTSNYLKLIYSDMCPIYVSWEGQKIKVAYSCYKWDNLYKNSRISLELENDIIPMKKDSLNEYYIMYDFEDI